MEFSLVKAKNHSFAGRIMALIGLKWMRILTAIVKTLQASEAN